MARPSKYSEEIAHRICTHLSYGATLDMAARSEGVSHDSVQRWMESKPEFCAQVERARGDAITQNLRNLSLQSNRGSTKATIWLLEHLAPQEFAPVAQRVEVSGDKDAPLTIRVVYDDAGSAPPPER